MKKLLHFSVLSLAIMSGILSFQATSATSGQIPIGFIEFSYIDENPDPQIIIPLGVGSWGFPATAVVFDDRAVIITFFCSYGSADAELCDGDIVVGTWHKPSGTQTMTIRLPVIPGDYTIYLYLQNGTILYGEYTLE